MDSSHLMAIFLAGAFVCAAGAGITFFYQQRWGATRLNEPVALEATRAQPNPIPIISIAPPASQAEAKQETPTQGLSSALLNPSKKEREELLDGIRDLSAIFVRKGIATFALADRLLIEIKRYYQGLRPNITEKDELIRRLQEVHDGAQDLMDTIFKEFISKHPYRLELISLLGNQKQNLDDLVTTTGGFIAEIHLVASINKDGDKLTTPAMNVLKHSFDSFERSAIDFRVWMDDSQRHMDATAQNLRAK